MKGLRGEGEGEGSEEVSDGGREDGRDSLRGNKGWHRQKKLLEDQTKEEQFQTHASNLNEF